VSARWHPGWARGCTPGWQASTSSLLVKKGGRAHGGAGTHAKALLSDRGLSISEVALRSGFATPSHFSTVFRRVTSATPREYRAALR